MYVLIGEIHLGFVYSAVSEDSSPAALVSAVAGDEYPFKSESSALGKYQLKHFCRIAPASFARSD